MNLFYSKRKKVYTYQYVALHNFLVEVLRYKFVIVFSSVLQLILTLDSSRGVFNQICFICFLGFFFLGGGVLAHLRVLVVDILGVGSDMPREVAAVAVG